MTIRFYSEESVPVEMHRARIVQKLQLLTIEERLEKIQEAGNNTFLLYNKDIYLDMLTDSGVNAMSDEMQAAMFVADDSYAGSSTYLKMANKLKEIFDMNYFLPAHQGRACEHILVKRFVKKMDIIPMNVRFDSIKEFISQAGAQYVELITTEALVVNSNNPFKGNFDLDKLENILKQREEKYQSLTIREITKEISKVVDIIYFSARKLGFARGGGICIRDENLYRSMQKYIPMYEGFTTYGGMSVKEMEAITVGLEETMEENVISHGPTFIQYMVNELDKYGIPVIKPGGGLGVHIDAKVFLPHVDMNEYPAGALAAALYICSGIRCMERGTISEQPNEDGSENFPMLELIRLALPRRVFSLSHVKYAVDRLKWLYDNRELVGGLTFIEQPKELRFYFGKLKPTSKWQEYLVKKFKEDFGDSL